MSTAYDEDYHKTEPTNCAAMTEDCIYHGEIWMKSFNLTENCRVSQRHRYRYLKNVVRPRTLRGELNSQTCDTFDGSEKLDETMHLQDDIEDSDEDNDEEKRDHCEQLLHEINTDLDRLYPTGNETLFQSSKMLLQILQNVLFVWCKLHKDVSYRQGMHDVAAVVLYSFLVEECLPDEPRDLTGNSSDPANASTSNVEAVDPDKVLAEVGDRNLLDLESDTFLVFEAIMVYLKPLYAIQSSNTESIRSYVSSSIIAADPTSCEKSLDGDADAKLFDDVYLEEEKDDSKYTLFAPSERPYSDDITQPDKLALHRLCQHIQYELLQHLDPQLYHHLKNLEIIPETYCLRWIRLLFTREFSLCQVLEIWDALILDENRLALDDWPDLKRHNCLDDLCLELAINNRESRWLGFPLLAYLCVAKLLWVSPQLLRSDSTGSLRILMCSNSATNETHTPSDLIKFAKQLQHPPREATEDSSGQIDVILFQESSLGIVLTASKRNEQMRLVVKDFVAITNTTERMGRAEASGKIRIGDVLQSINGVPVISASTEDIKRHLNLVGRPVYISFLHVTDASGDSKVNGCASTPNSDSAAVVSESTAEILPFLLPGEMCFAHVESSINSILLTHEGACIMQYTLGTLYVTNYRCCFLRHAEKRQINWQIPVLSIVSIEDISTSTAPVRGTAIEQAQAALGLAGVDSTVLDIVILCKDTKVGKFKFSDPTEHSKIVKCLHHLAFPSNLLDAFCFSYAPTIAPSDHFEFDIRRDYQRIGLLDVPARLRCIDQSVKYELCQTYPQHLIVPAEVSDVRIKSVAAFRSLNRLPVVCWMHRENGATICRSSQPYVGLKSARSSSDEILVRLLSYSSRSSGRYIIMDARSQLASVGNKALGKGTELSSNYSGANIMYMNIDNIHATRQSFDALRAVFVSQELTHADSSSGAYGRIENSGWLRHVRLVIKASVEIAKNVYNGTSVLTHCSDGWDRTAQMISLAELMLDPYYRTIRGFQDLIEKEWCGFGHPFATRYGHGRGDVSSDQRSPIFLMFLDCVWQFLRQYPVHFEFSEKFLLTLADHVHSCKFGTFLMNSEKERREILSRYPTCSVWSEVNAQNDQFVNPFFTPSQNVPDFIVPNTFSKNIRLWEGYFCRFDATIVPSEAIHQNY